MDKPVYSLRIAGPSKTQVSDTAAELDENIEQFHTPDSPEVGPFTFVADDALILRLRECGRVAAVFALMATGATPMDTARYSACRSQPPEEGAGRIAFDLHASSAVSLAGSP